MVRRYCSSDVTDKFSQKINDQENVFTRFPHQKAVKRLLYKTTGIHHLSGKQLSHGVCQVWSIQNPTSTRRTWKVQFSVHCAHCFSCLLHSQNHRMQHHSVIASTKITTAHHLQFLVLMMSRVYTYGYSFVHLEAGPGRPDSSLPSLLLLVPTPPSPPLQAPHIWQLFGNNHGACPDKPFMFCSSGITIQTFLNECIPVV